MSVELGLSIALIVGMLIGVWIGYAWGRHGSRKDKWEGK